MSDQLCEFVFLNGGFLCELPSGHDGVHRAWRREGGVPTLVKSDGCVD